jgi:uncharacterized membrane protein YfcA
MMELLLLLGAMLAVGLFAGFIGGMFGIGGGVVIVPTLYLVFGYLDVPDDVRIKIAVGTSLATIIVTSIRSVSTHHKHGAVDVALLRHWAPWIALGAITGAALARFIEADFLTGFFAVGILGLALQKGFFPAKEKAGADDLAPVPGGIIRAGLATITGTVSSLMGIGGGVLGVVILTGFGRTIHQAIATAAGFGLAIALPGMIGFIMSGWGAEGLPAYSFGFVSLPAFAAIAAMTFLTTPLGANLAHRLDKTLLNRIFAGYMALTGILLLRDVLVS